MSGLPYGKFFWNDWLGDPLLGLCSLAAQGLWMKMLCLAAEAPRAGFVMVAGRPAEPNDLARLTGERLEAIETIIAELERNGVFSRDRHGTIYSRRMVRDAKKQKSSAKGGKIGGRVTLEKQIGIHGTRGTARNGTRDATRPPESRSQNPEARDQKEIPPLPPTQSAGEARAKSKPKGRDDPGFEALAKAYPHPPGSSIAKAFKVWQSVQGRLPDEAELLARVAAFRAHIAAENRRRAKDDPFRVCSLATWLAEERWATFAPQAAEGAAMPNPPAWGARGEALAERLGPAVFAQWFAGADLDEGPPATITVDKPFKQRWIESHFRQALERVFGEGVHIVCAAEAKAA